MNTTTRPRPTHIGDQITDITTARTFTVTAHPGDQTCPVCAGLVRTWTRYTLTHPNRHGRDAYITTAEARHLLTTGLLGQCPGAGDKPEEHGQ